MDSYSILSGCLSHVLFCRLWDDFRITPCFIQMVLCEEDIAKERCIWTAVLSFNVLLIFSFCMKFLGSCLSTCGGNESRGPGMICLKPFWSWWKTACCHTTAGPSKGYLFSYNILSSWISLFLAFLLCIGCPKKCHIEFLKGENFPN